MEPTPTPCFMCRHCAPATHHSEIDDWRAQNFELPEPQGCVVGSREQLVPVLGRVPEGVRGAALFLPLTESDGPEQPGPLYCDNTLAGVGMDDRYAGIERDLVHVENALQTLSQNRDEFPLGASIRDPAYWQARLESIRDTADRYNYLDLRDRSDDLLIEISKLQYWTARRRDTDVGSTPASRGSARPQRK